MAGENTETSIPGVYAVGDVKDKVTSSDSNSSGRWCYGSTYGRRVCGEITIRI